MMSGSARRYVRKEGGWKGDEERVGRMEERRGEGKGVDCGREAAVYRGV
jgi:hypothetical protein